MMATATFVLVASVGGSPGCAEHGVTVGVDEPSSPSFTTKDDSGAGDAGMSPAETPAMCPVTTCSLPHATCPSSNFPCDVNLLTDNDNCGACGVRCDGPNTGNSKWSCVDGKCAFSCDDPRYRNCDGNPTNGCETRANDNTNCGACGHVCPADTVCTGAACKPVCEAAGFPDDCAPPDFPDQHNCTDKRTDNDNCGVCGNRCDPTGPGLPALPTNDMYYGCGDKKCTLPKCKDKTKANCNLDVTDGCEATLGTEENCARCGDKCAPGQICFSPPLGTPQCICAPGETLCFGVLCVHADDDPDNCGGCNQRCAGFGRPHYAPTCTLGVCGGRCEEKFADCDGLTDNGCEIDTRVDNRNCGSCGHACLPGQVCSAGECLVAPCDTEGPTTK
ncbi:hypothetical protein AKJ09_06974 [Labilithrix luteola]|uniref:Tryptophan synthase alpha chain n=1 Tax=Labilithrix luteola TaxID=1391654 RepID=A0A0K1Q391_9BACT|nr:hypothetical protein AKJ09_06974 [Labilithrix luteola]